MKVDYNSKTKKLKETKLYESLINSLKRKNNEYENFIIYLLMYGNKPKKDAPEKIKKIQGILNSKPKNTERLYNEEEEIYSLIEYNIGVTRGEIKSNRKTKKITKARSILEYLLRNRYELSFNEIGEITNKNHATVLQACKRFQNGHPKRFYKNNSLNKVYESIKKNYRN